MPILDFHADNILGIESTTTIDAVIKEITLGTGIYFAIYPILTATRRVSLSSLENCSSSVFKTMWDIAKKEGISKLYRGFGAY